MKATRSRRCALCRKLHPTADDARECESLPRPEARFQAGDTVYPRYAGLPGGAMTIWKSRIVRGTHAVEHALRPVGRKSGSYVWVDDRYCFPTAEERAAARVEEKRPPRRREAGRTTSARASYTRAFQLNREMAAKRRAAGKCVYVYRCRSNNHGRAMRFFAAQKSRNVRCPACGAGQEVPPEGGRIPVEFVGQEGNCP